jgi:hypothetical protein
MLPETSWEPVMTCSAIEPIGSVPSAPLYEANDLPEILLRLSNSKAAELAGAAACEQQRAATAVTHARNRATTEAVAQTAFRTELRARLAAVDAIATIGASVLYENSNLVVQPSGVALSAADRVAFPADFAKPVAPAVSPVAAASSTVRSRRPNGWA